MTVQYKTYTIADLRDWLLQNKENGLSQDAINRARAYAFIHNPCAKDDDVVLVVVFDENHRLVGYTGAFAEDYLEGNVIGRFFWGSTEWLSPELRGKGIGSKMMDLIKHAVGYQSYLGLASSVASVKLDSRQGSKIHYYPQFRLVTKSGVSLKSKLATWHASFFNKRMKQKMSRYSYEIRAVSYLDNETYQFVRAHSSNDLFLRSQDMFNWLLRFPFVQLSQDQHHLEKDNYYFKNYVGTYVINAIQVRVENTLVGFYIVSHMDKVCTLRYLYYDTKFSNEVFASVANSLLRPGNNEIRFFESELFAFMQKHGFKSLNTKDIYQQISFTSPGDFIYNQSLHLQGGDGDMLT